MTHRQEAFGGAWARSLNFGPRDSAVNAADRDAVVFRYLGAVGRAFGCGDAESPRGRCPRPCAQNARNRCRARWLGGQGALQLAASGPGMAAGAGDVAMAWCVGVPATSPQQRSSAPFFQSDQAYENVPWTV